MIAKYISIYSEYQLYESFIILIELAHTLDFISNIVVSAKGDIKNAFSDIKTDSVTMHFQIIFVFPKEVTVWFMILINQSLFHSNKTYSFGKSFILFEHPPFRFDILRGGH